MPLPTQPSSKMTNVPAPRASPPTRAGGRLGVHPALLSEVAAVPEMAVVFGVAWGEELRPPIVDRM